MNDIRPPSRPLPRPPQRPVMPARPQAQVVRPAFAPSPSPQVSDTSPPRPMVLAKPKRKWAKRLFITLGILTVLLGGAVFAAYTWYTDALQPYSTSQEQVKLTIEQGTSVARAATVLEEKKLIKSAFALELYVRLHNQSDIKAGNYVFTPNQSPTEILTWLNEGRIDTFKVTILPGKTLAELKESFKKYGFSDEAITRAYTKKYEHPLLAGKPNNSSLEGYIHPETYSVTPDTPLEDIIYQGFDVMYKQIQQKGIEQKISAEGFNLYQAITLASIIEKEVAKADQPQVAQVFLTRLQRNMALGSDVTYHYGAALLGVPPSPDLDSPYNTRIHVGLPPGPISNFNLEALDAVANPASGDYLFFVAGDDGKTYFSHTLQEHEANIRSYCQKLCSQN